LTILAKTRSPTLRVPQGGFSFAVVLVTGNATARKDGPSGEAEWVQPSVPSIVWRSFDGKTPREAVVKRGCRLSGRSCRSRLAPGRSAVRVRHRPPARARPLVH